MSIYVNPATLAVTGTCAIGPSTFTGVYATRPLASFGVATTPAPDAS